MTRCLTLTNNSAGVQAHLVVTHSQVVVALVTLLLANRTSRSKQTLLTVYTTTVAPTHLFLSSNMTSKKSKGFGADEVEETLPPVMEEVKKVRKPRAKKVEEPELETAPEPEPEPTPEPPAPVERKKLHRIIKRR